MTNFLFDTENCKKMYTTKNNNKKIQIIFSPNVNVVKRRGLLSWYCLQKQKNNLTDVDIMTAGDKKNDCSLDETRHLLANILFYTVSELVGRKYVLLTVNGTMPT